MEVNCCVFPAPTDFKLGKSMKQILLIPTSSKNDVQGACLFYHQKYLNQTQGSNLFENFLNKRGKIKKSRATTANETRQEMSENLQRNSESYGNNKKSYSIVSTDLLSEDLDGKQLPKVKDQIPCLFLLGKNTDKIILMFHGNGEDLSTSYDFAHYLNLEFQLSVMLMEYRGYSIYKGSPSPQNIIVDAQRVIEFLNFNGVQAQEIILFGRSIGGGIAFELASMVNISALILLSPFLSLKKIAQDLYGKSASCLLKQTLNNHSAAEKVQCPIMLIHGLKDTLVPYQHSIAILGQCKSYSRLKLAENMTHTKFNFRNDFMIPVKQFMLDLQLIPR